MFTYHITVDESLLERNYPGIARERFGQLLQRWVNDMMADDSLLTANAVSPNAQTYEEMKSALRKRIEKIEAGEATFYTNEEVFSDLRDRYGLNC